MDQVCAQPRTDPTTLSGRVANRHRLSKTTSRVGFNSGGWQSFSIKTDEEQRS